MGYFDRSIVLHRVTIGANNEDNVPKPKGGFPRVYAVGGRTAGLVPAPNSKDGPTGLNPWRVQSEIGVEGAWRKIGGKRKSKIISYCIPFADFDKNFLPYLVQSPP